MKISLLAKSSLVAALAFTFAAAFAQAPRKELVAAVVANYPPLEFKDPASGKLTGFDVELGEAIAAKMGTKIRWEETSFDQMVNSVATGRADLIISGMNDLASRRDRLRFIDYLTTGPQFYVQAGRGAEFASLQALCGKKVGASRRTSFPADIAAWSEANCVKAGKPAMEVLGTDGSADARTQLKQGRLDAAVQGGETLPYLMGLEANTFKLVGKPIFTAYLGIGIERKNEALSQEMGAAFAKLIADGSYAKLLAKWGLGEHAVPKLLFDASPN
jgi:polar amino acid transport system substrate-binding protein